MENIILILKIHILNLKRSLLGFPERDVMKLTTTSNYYKKKSQFIVKFLGKYNK